MNTENRRVASEKLPLIFTYEMYQDDPAKCTSAKMRKFRIASPIRREKIPRESIVLNPNGGMTLLPKDRVTAQGHGLVVIDCSWNLADSAFSYHFRGNQRRLPALMAGNPINYSKLGSLSSIEAIGGAFYIMNFKGAAERLLSLYKWGSTFLSLNHDPLEEYSKATNEAEILEIQKSFFPRIE